MTSHRSPETGTDQPGTAHAHLEAAARELGSSASGCRDTLVAAALSTARQAADTALLALAATRTADDGERTCQLLEAVASARATVLTCTMAIYRAEFEGEHAGEPTG